GGRPRTGPATDRRRPGAPRHRGRPRLRLRRPRGRRPGAGPAPGRPGRRGPPPDPVRRSRARRPRPAPRRRWRRRGLPLNEPPAGAMATGFLLPGEPLGTLADWLALGGG